MDVGRPEEICGLPFFLESSRRNLINALSQMLLVLRPYTLQQHDRQRDGSGDRRYEQTRIVCDHADCRAFPVQFAQ